MSDVVIMGAGLSDLVSAVHLLDLGVKSITILEGRTRVGAGSRRTKHDTGLNVIDNGESIKRIAQPLDSTKVRFEGGAAAIADALATDAGELRSWSANVVFFAIPPRLALPPVMSWELSLPAEVSTAANQTPTWMAYTTTRKVLVTYQDPFWRALSLSGNAVSYSGGPIQELYDSCGPPWSDGPYALCGFVLGDDATGPPADDDLRPQVLQQLERIFGSEARSPLSFSSHRWNEQPLTSGNGGASGGGHDSMGHVALRKLFGSGSRSRGCPPRVWLSASETSGEYSGLVEGALRRGTAVVDEAIRSGALIAVPDLNATEGPWL